MKLVPLLTLAAAGVIAIRPALAEHPDLTGTWRLDPAASIFADPASHATNGTLAISKHHKTIHIAENLTYPHGEKTAEADWRVDDRFHPVDTPGALGAGELLSKWDGDSLVGERRFNESAEQIRFSMRSPGTLSEHIHHPGMPDITLVWTRQ